MGRLLIWLLVISLKSAGKARAGGVLHNPHRKADICKLNLGVTRKRKGLELEL